MKKEITIQIFVQAHTLILFLLLSQSFPHPLIPNLSGPLGAVLQMAEEGMEGMEGMEGAAMAGGAAMEAADMAMMGGKTFLMIELNSITLNPFRNCSSCNDDDVHIPSGIEYRSPQRTPFEYI